MRQRIHRPICAVHRRRRIQQIFIWSAWGLFLAACLLPFSPILSSIILFTSILAGIVRPISFLSSAKWIDKHYCLKDRTTTALFLLNQSSPTPIAHIQIEDTAEKLAAVQPQKAFPFRVPCIFWFALILFTLDTAFFTALMMAERDHLSPHQEIAKPADNIPANKELREMLTGKTEELVQKYPQEECIQNLPKQLEALLNKLDQAKGDNKETLMTLSEMEETFQSLRDSLQLEIMETMIQELAETLELSETTLPISNHLKKGEYQQAAEKLREVGGTPVTLDSLSEPERNALKEQMQILAEHAEEQGQKPIQDAAENLADALEAGDQEQAASASDELADEIETFGLRKEIGKNLAQQQMLLSMTKSDGGQDGMNGGKGTDKPKAESQSWGLGSAGNPNAGKATDLQGERQREMLSGMLGEEGNSQREKIDSQESASGKSLLEYREQYREYRQLSEAVLDTEPIPLGERQVIRRYFESISPQ